MNHDTETSDDRSSFAKAMDTASEVFTACLMMVLPGVGGHYLDRYLDTAVTFTFLGILGGMVSGIFRMVKILNKLGSE